MLDAEERITNMHPPAYTLLACLSIRPPGLSKTFQGTAPPPLSTHPPTHTRMHVLGKGKGI